MRLTIEEQEANARDWLACSNHLPDGCVLEPGEKVDREALAEQMQYTIADAEDVEAVAEEIERLAGRQKTRDKR